MKRRWPIFCKKAPDHTSQLLPAAGYCGEGSATNITLSCLYASARSRQTMLKVVWAPRLVVDREYTVSPQQRA